MISHNAMRMVVDEGGGTAHILISDMKVAGKTGRRSRAGEIVTRGLWDIL